MAGARPRLGRRRAPAAALALGVAACLAVVGQPPLPARGAFAAAGPRQQRRAGLRAAGAAAGAGVGTVSSSSVVDELLRIASSADPAELSARVDADFPKLTPEDLNNLQTRFASGEESEKEAIKAVTTCIQGSMDSRMEKATKDLDALLQSSGNIEDNIRECLAKQDSPLPLMAVLQLNIAKASEGGNDKMVQALTFVFKTMNAELEKDLPAPKVLLTRVLAMEDSSSRRQALRSYFKGAPAEGDIASDLAGAIVQLVADVEAQYGGADAEGGGERRQASLELVRRVALDAGVVVGEAQGEAKQTKFTEQLVPLFEALSRV